MEELFQLLNTIHPMSEPLSEYLVSVGVYSQIPVSEYDGVPNHIGDTYGYWVKPIFFNPWFEIQGSYNPASAGQSHPHYALYESSQSAALNCYYLKK